MDPIHFQQGCAGALIFNDKEEVLLVKRADNDDFFPGFWELPGGGIDYGESPQKSLKREIQEECGLTIDVSYPLGIHTYIMPVNDKESQRIEITFLCLLQDPHQQVVLSHEYSAYQWVHIKNIPRFELSDYMKQVITDALNNPIVQKL